MISTSQASKHDVVSQSDWIEASKQLLEKEKELTRQRDEVSRQRRELPWVKVDKTYTFDTPDGKKTLSDLFDGRSQLIVYHFMFAPNWDEGCDGCAFLYDHVDGARQHFEQHDVSFIAVSRASLGKLEAFKKRMGWSFRWVSSDDGDFNYDYNVSYHQPDLDRGPVFHNFKVQMLQSQDQPGASVFYKDEQGTVYHTYSTYERGGDLLIGTYNFLDLTPKGRNEKGPLRDWMRLHDLYGQDKKEEGQLG